MFGALNSADWAIIAIIAVSVLISFSRGFVKEAVSLLIWVAAFVIAITLDSAFAELLRGVIDSPSIRQMTAFAILFIATLLVGSLVNHLLGSLVRMTGLSGSDRLLGVLFGVVRGVVIIMALVIFLPLIIPAKQEQWWQQSQLLPYFLDMEQWFRDIFSQSIDFFSGWI